MASSLKKLDIIDQLSIPLFVGTMIAEHRALAKRPRRRTLGDLADADLETLSGTQLPPDPLVPLGYERKDTQASLTMLLGSVAIMARVTGLSPQVIELTFSHRPPASPIRPLNDADVAAQQRTADLFYANRILPRAVSIAPAVWRPGP